MHHEPLKTNTLVQHRCMTRLDDEKNKSGPSVKMFRSVLCSEEQMSSSSVMSLDGNKKKSGPSVKM